MEERKVPTVIIGNSSSVHLTAANRYCYVFGELYFYFLKFVCGNGP